MIAPTGMDGQPIDPVAPGATFDYAFPVVQRAGLSFYHPHPHGLTGKQVNLGLAGPIVVHDDEESALDLVGRYHEIPLIIRDAAFDSAGVLRYRATSSGFQGDTPLVNGTLDPNIGIDNALYRLRVLNGSNARVLQLALSDGAPFTIIGNDGGLLAAPATVLELTAAPAERFDLLVDFRGLGLGQTAMLQDLSSGWDLLEFEVTQEVDDTHQVPTGPLSTIEPLGAPVRTRDFSFEGMGKINGLSYDPARIDFSVPFGDTELWRFTTGGNAPHPVHVHGMPFQVQSRTGGRNQLFPWEAGWKDTVLLADGETVEALVRFDEYRGQYLIHCHQLEHEDNGMMLAFSVV
jgi:FtsP/CotA-like multicopper oxidase with cupredoxin domain